MFPDRCAVISQGKRCVNPPLFIISISSGSEEYMVGVACHLHKSAVSGKIALLQERNEIPQGKIKFTKLKAVGTDCINAKPDDLIHI